MHERAGFAFGITMFDFIMNVRACFHSKTVAKKGTVAKVLLGLGSDELGEMQLWTVFGDLAASFKRQRLAKFLKAVV